MGEDFAIEKILLTLKKCSRFKNKSISKMRLIVELCIKLHLWLESEEGKEWLKSEDSKKWINENPGAVASWIGNHKNDYMN